MFLKNILIIVVTVAADRALDQCGPDVSFVSQASIS